MSDSRIGCVVLAAGFARRFGTDKRQAPLPDGGTLLSRTLHNAAPAFSERLLVLHAGDTELWQHYAPQWQAIIAQDAALGLGHSLAAALPYVQEWEGMVVALGDMPWVQSATYAEVKERLNAQTLVVPYYQGQRGNPVGIGRDFFAALAAPEGELGARALFERHASALVRCTVNDRGILRDVDVPDDL
ncbi:MAG: nucleotidyltransferase family protein [Pseudomonadales bacterium]|jgi:molybdenum cofactor cytidylyltransferase|nr:nucleotidyltransferase family protein [Pseudomonadales bacterium]